MQEAALCRLVLVNQPEFKRMGHTLQKPRGPTCAPYSGPVHVVFLLLPCFQPGSPQISSPPLHSNPTQPSRPSLQHTFLAQPTSICSLTHGQLFPQTHKNCFNNLSQILLPNHIDVYSKTTCASLPASTTWTCGGHMGDH